MSFAGVAVIVVSRSRVSVTMTVVRVNARVSVRVSTVVRVSHGRMCANRAPVSDGVPQLLFVAVSDQLLVQMRVLRVVRTALSDLPLESLVATALRVVRLPLGVRDDLRLISGHVVTARVVICYDVGVVARQFLVHHLTDRSHMIVLGAADTHDGGPSLRRSMIMLIIMT